MSITVELQPVSIVGSCMSCKRGDIDDNGNIIFPYQEVFVVNFGSEEIKLCPDCASNLIGRIHDLRNDKDMIKLIKEGQDRARKQGKRIGRHRTGFDIVKALELKANGCSLREIGRQLGISYSVVNRTLKELEKKQENG